MTSPDAFALRAFRMDSENNQYLNFEAVTFPHGPRIGCETMLRRADICGISEDGAGPLGVDVLAENGDILQTFTLSRKAFEYLRSKLKLRREQPPTRQRKGVK